jgi:hypothetical protein
LHERSTVPADRAVATDRYRLRGTGKASPLR